MDAAKGIAILSGNGGSIQKGDVLLVTLKGSKTLSMRLTVDSVRHLKNLNVVALPQEALEEISRDLPRSINWTATPPAPSRKPAPCRPTTPTQSPAPRRP